MAQKLKKRAEKKLDSNNDTNRSGTPIGRGCRGRGRKKGGFIPMNHRQEQVTEDIDEIEDET
jgi:hypothetical protein